MYALQDREGRRWAYDETREEAEERRDAQADPTYYKVVEVPPGEIPEWLKNSCTEKSRR